MNKLIMVLIGAVLFIQATLFTSLSTAASHFTQLYVFGDSLSDVGNDLILSRTDPNVPPIPPPTRYFFGRFSNGPVWVDYLAKNLRLFPLLPSEALLPPEGNVDLPTGINVSFCYGGAGTGIKNDTPDGFLTVRGLLGQVQHFVKAVETANPDALYVVSSGPNDYLLSMPPPNSVDGIPFPPDPGRTVSNIITAIENLYNFGARKFLVPNLPDLGNIPVAAVFGIQDSLTELTYLHNDNLEKELDYLKANYEDIIIYDFDIFKLFKKITKRPKKFGFSNTTTDLGPAAGCLVLLPPDFQQDCSPISLNHRGSIFWDAQHPSTRLHKILNYKALKILNATNEAP